MRFQTFDAIRLENFAFKFDLNDFLERVEAMTLPLFAFKRFFSFSKQKNAGSRPLTPFFFLQFTQKLANHQKLGDIIGFV